MTTTGIQAGKFGGITGGKRRTVKKPSKVKYVSSITKDAAKEKKAANELKKAKAKIDKTKKALEKAKKDAKKAQKRIVSTSQKAIKRVTKRSSTGKKGKKTTRRK